MRTFVIISNCDGVNIKENIVNHLPDGSEVLVYTRKSLEGSDF